MRIRMIAGASVVLALGFCSLLNNSAVAEGIRPTLSVLPQQRPTSVTPNTAVTSGTVSVMGGGPSQEAAQYAKKAIDLEMEVTRLREQQNKWGQLLNSLNPISKTLEAGNANPMVAAPTPS